MSNRRLRILTLAKYGTRAASTRQRLLQYQSHLENNGIDLEIRALLDDAYLERLARGENQPWYEIIKSYIKRMYDLTALRQFDAVWLQYEAFPYFPSFAERMVTWAGVPLVYDIDDAIFHQYDQHSSPMVRLALGGKLVPLLRGASACLCGNAYLQRYVEPHCQDSLVVPTVVDTDVFEPPEQIRDQGSSHLPLVVGWIGSPSTWAFVEPLLPTLLPTLLRLGLRFRVIGAGPRARNIAGVEAVEWNEDREVAEIQGMDVGIMPLPDEHWAKGKCGYKLIQYMACGVPTIASPIGVNNKIVEDGSDGFLANSPEDWVNALQRLAENPTLRLEMGQKGRKKVVANYSLRSQQDVVLSVLLDAAGHDTHRHGYHA